MSRPVMSARVDRDDRLVEADDAFAALNARAGGDTGALLGVPQLATIARLARRLGILVQRGVTIADAEGDLECWVRATPVTTGVALTVTPMRERPAWRATVAPDAVAPPPAGADWTWETDATLRLTRVGARDIDGSGLIGRPLTRMFVLEPDEDGALPLLESLATRRDFTGQRASLAGSRVMLAGSARLTAAGDFAGFAGGTFALDPPPAADVLTPLFSSRLDRILRGPLGRIIANADSINAAHDGPLDPHYADYAADIASAGRHLMALVDDLVDLEAIEREDFAIERDTIDLADVVRRAAGLFAVRASDSRVAIDLAGADQPIAAVGEFRRALQIMVNLIGNAVRYSPAGATVWLRVQHDAGRAAVIVADGGKGIAIEDQARIFEKFARIDPAEPGGSGLGLYIARRLARAMAGDLTVDSAPGDGARFVLTLPAR